MSAVVRRKYPTVVPGMTVGGWTLLEREPRGADRLVWWKVRCKCGVIAVRQLNSILAGHSRQCRDCAAKSRFHLVTP